MTGTFFGKWRFHLPPNPMMPNYPTNDGWASDAPSPGTIDVGGFQVWYTYGFPTPTGPYPPTRETNITLLLRADGQLCFRLNNGYYVGYDIFECPLVDTLEKATGFLFPGHDFHTLTTPFDSYIQLTQDNSFLMANADRLFGNPEQQLGVVFTMSQITPSMVSVQTSGIGDSFDFSGVDFTGCSFSAVSFTKADFSNCNLSNAIFNGCDFTNANLTNANLTGATFNFCTMDGASLNNCTLTDTDFTGTTLFGTHLESVTFQRTNLSQTHFAGAVFKQSDLTSVTFDPAYPAPQFYKRPLAPPSPTNPRTIISGCTLNQSVFANDLSMLDLTNSTLNSLTSSPTQPLKAIYSILKGLNNNKLIGLSLQNAVFDYAIMDGLALNSSGTHLTDLTKASFIQASMHGTNLSGAILKGANMTGAQLGSLSELFTLDTKFTADLNAGPTVDAALRAQFSQHGITISENATLNVEDPNRVWRLDDLGNNTIYTIRLETNADHLTVYLPAISASLADAYMPDAVLTGANLYGVLATGAQFYGASALIDGLAILEGAEFNDANLSTANFTQANLFGANLSGAQLFNAHFNGAKLTPASNGVSTNLIGANLQGAEFTDAHLDGANLENAAVAVKVPTKDNPNQGGVYLFSLPYPNDKHILNDYLTELNAAATTLFSLNPDGDQDTLDKYVAALQANNLAALKVPFAQHKITFSTNAKIQPVAGEATVWQIVDGPQSYTLWEAPDEEDATELYAAWSLPITTAAFQHNGQVLRWQTSATVDAPGQQWLLDNDSTNWQDAFTGYVKFILSLNDTRNDSVLDVYGSAVRVIRLGDGQQLEVDTENCNPTKLVATNLSAQTICPNGTKVSDQSSTWETWMRAAPPPRPPDCVPTIYHWCDPASTKRKQTGGGS